MPPLKMPPPWMMELPLPVAELPLMVLLVTVSADAAAA